MSSMGPKRVAEILQQYGPRGLEGSGIPRPVILSCAHDKVTIALAGMKATCFICPPKDVGGRKKWQTRVVLAEV